MSQRLFRIALLPAVLLAFVAPGLWRAQEVAQRSSNSSSQQAIKTLVNIRSYGDLPVGAGEASFALKNLLLVRAMGSTIVKGNISNETNRRLSRTSFEIRAYDADGQPLKGVEARTIFEIQPLRAGASVAINSGYGVWMEGVSLDAINRIEVVETDDGERVGASPSWVKWLNHSLVAWASDAELEE
ncbi:MAG TPA: FxLYD domain-containing protein [Pyrinomonadaceae bacterium]|jgi:hypothetical protein